MSRYIHSSITRRNPSLVALSFVVRGFTDTYTVGFPTPRETVHVMWDLELLTLNATSMTIFPQFLDANGNWRSVYDTNGSRIETTISSLPFLGHYYGGTDQASGARLSFPYVAAEAVRLGAIGDPVLSTSYLWNVQVWGFKAGDINPGMR